MRIFVAQIEPHVGHLSYNFKLIEKYYKEACANNCDICVFPELSSTGYIPEDLLLKPSFLEDLEQNIQAIIKIIGTTALLLPVPIATSNGLKNGAIVIQEGKIIGQTTKFNLPNYGIFDEKRYFTKGNSEVITINNTKIGIAICEDFWFTDVPRKLKEYGAQILIVINASPFEKGKFETRLNIAKQRYSEVSLPIIYCNQVLGQDGIIYDGRSFVYDGKLKTALKPFIEDTTIVEFNNNSLSCDSKIQEYSDEDIMYGAMVYGLKSYVLNNGFTKVILGLSGGIDSALVAGIAADALGAENVIAVMLPYTFTSKESLEDAEEIVKLLSIKYKVINIEDMVKAFSKNIDDISPLAFENMQARIRGLVLMTLSNSISGSLLLTTGNKSEIAVGYATLYGDMCGAFNPIKDLYKTDVFKISQYRNSTIPLSFNVKTKVFPIMPARVISKAPSAELRPDQKDVDSLPEYSVLDRILSLYIENDLGIEKIVNMGYDRLLVEKIINLIRNSEYKRKQSAIGVKLSTKDFARDRRYPITNGYSN